jgi:hypothetical protein
MAATPLEEGPRRNPDQGKRSPLRAQNILCQMAGRPLRRARRVAETIACTGGDLPETWGIPSAELAFSAAAAHALLTHHGNVRPALRAIAPNTASLPVSEQRNIARRVFSGNPFVDILRAEVDRERKRLLATAVRIGLDPANPGAAVRAIDSLARIAGWYASTRQEAAPPVVRSTVHSVADELALMQHEPGEAVGLPPESRNGAEIRPAHPAGPGLDDDSDDVGDVDDRTARRKQTIRMRELGRLGGLAVQASSRPPEYFRRLGGIATARRPGADTE